jgi:hypothetical protein
VLAESAAPADVCVVASGNRNPPAVLSIVPATLSICAGVAVPMPTKPFGVMRIRSAHVAEPTGVLVNCRYVPCAASVQFSAALYITCPRPDDHAVAP